jgi:ribosomal protein S18 acetylase RimI-like enzyme
VRLIPASRFSRAELTELFNDGYEGYFIPMHVDPAAYEYMVSTWDIDLGRSRVALGDGEERLGFANLAVRGGRGWIGGVGVVPAARRAGIGRALMEAVLAEAPPTVLLEVLEQNEPAIRLYERLGFERTRVLEVWSLTRDVTAAGAEAAEPAPLGQRDLPWQRADESLPAEYDRLDVDGGSILFRARDGRVNVLQLAARDEDAAAQLLAAAKAGGDSLHYVNVPEGDRASAALQALGATLDLRQYEMALLR